MKRVMILISGVIVLGCANPLPENCVITRTYQWGENTEYNYDCENGYYNYFYDNNGKYSVGDSLFLTTPKTK